VGAGTAGRLLDIKEDDLGGLTVNIRGLLPRNNRTKVAHLSDLANDSNAPFIALQETHLSEAILTAEIQIKGYSLYRSDRQGGRTHGGCAVYTRDDLTVRELFKYSNNYCESQVLEIRELELLLINIYRPPSTPKQLFEETLEKIQKVIEEEAEKDESKSKSKTLLALGDFNFPFLKWPSKRIYARDREPEQMASEKTQAMMMLDWAERNFMEQYIHSSTRQGNILDLVFSNSDSLINGYSTIVNTVFSDHNTLRLSLNVTIKNDKKATKRRNPYPNKIFEYDLLNGSREDWIRYDAIIWQKYFEFEQNTINENTDEMLKRFYNLLEETVELLFDKKESFKTDEEKAHSKRKNKIPIKIRILLRKQSSISKKILASKSGTKTYKLMVALKQIEVDLETSRKKMRTGKENIALGKIKRNPKYFYSYANSFSKSKNTIGPLLNEAGETIKEPQEMAEMLRRQYEAAFSKPDPEFNLDEFYWTAENGEIEEELENENEEEDPLENEVTSKEDENPEIQGPLQGPARKPELTQVYFTYADVEDAIGKLSPCGGPGPDGVSACLLKKSKSAIALMLNKIFHRSVENGEIPDILKLGYICPILKPESSRQLAASWRPISLTCHVIKTLERVIRGQIVCYLEHNQMMDPDQHGSRQRRSCLSQLLEHHDEILRKMEEGGNIDVIYTDFAKAYDKVDHLILLKKLKEQFGISGKLGSWLENFLIGRKQQVIIEGTTSAESTVASGSIQGSVLGPVLFLMYIRDIGEGVKADMKIFVDDAKIKDVIEDEDDVEDLQNNLEKLYEWKNINNMKFNGSKFQLIRYGPNEDIKNNTLYFTEDVEEIIERVPSLRDLGVIMSDTAKFDDHIDHVSKKVRIKVGWILRTFYTRRTDIMKQLWKTLVQCHIDYCSQLYMPGNAQNMHSIEKLLYDYTRKIPEVRHEDYWMRLKLLQMSSQERRMERYRIFYIWKILEDKAPNCGVSLAPKNDRLGRKCEIPKLKSNGRMAIQTLREQSFQVNGARLFNRMPKKIREIRSNKDEFKEALDGFLRRVPDQPRIGTLVPTAVCRVTGRQSNSLLAWVQDT
jgi:endonuclease/exonuclease/phosphatase family metal-dependent hydrolase